MHVQLEVRVCVCVCVRTAGGHLPLRPARAVLPTLWMYCFTVDGML